VEGAKVVVEGVVLFDDNDDVFDFARHRMSSLSKIPICTEWAFRFELQQSLCPRVDSIFLRNTNALPNFLDKSLPSRLGSLLRPSIVVGPAYREAGLASARPGQAVDAGAATGLKNHMPGEKKGQLALTT
jgi:hypothetical protein